jgi:hypothetical protein
MDCNVVFDRRTLKHMRFDRETGTWSEVEPNNYVDANSALSAECDRFREALAALERLARTGHGPVFTQKSVGIGQRAAMGTGDDTQSFCAAIVALEKTV